MKILKIKRKIPKVERMMLKKEKRNNINIIIKNFSLN